MISKNHNPNFSKAKMLKDTVKKWVVENVETLGIAVVLNVDDYATDRMVSVQPVTNNVDKDGVITVPAYIEKCPVILQGTTEGFMSFPIKVGDKVLVAYPKRSIEEFTFSTSTDNYEPVDDVLFGSAQAVVLGFIAQAGVDYSLNPDDFEIKFKQGRFTIKDDNSLILSNPNFTFEVDGDGGVGISNGAVTIILNTDGTFSITGTGNGTINSCTVTTTGNIITGNGTDLDQLKADHDALEAAYITHGSGAPNHPPPAP